jgi:hypothetical protein
MPTSVGDLFEEPFREDVVYAFDELMSAFFLFINKSDRFSISTYIKNPLLLRYPFLRARKMMEYGKPISVITPIAVLDFSIRPTSNVSLHGDSISEQYPSMSITVVISDISLELLTKYYGVSEIEGKRILDNKKLLTLFKNYCREVLSHRDLGLAKENITIVPSNEEV